MARNFMTDQAPPSWGGTHFGLNAMNRMLNAGHSYTALNEGAKRWGYQWGEAAAAQNQRHLSTHPKASGNWLTSYMGNEGGLGIEGYNRALASGRSDQAIADAFSGSRLRINQGARDLNTSNLAAIQAKEDKEELDYEQNIADLKASLEEQMEEFRASLNPTIQRSGNPGAVGKPAAGMSIAKGTNYSGGNRGTSSLKRDSAAFINNLGGVNTPSKNTSPLNIK